MWFAVRIHFGGYREDVLRRDHWTCQGCFYRPAQQDRDWIVVHHRVPGVSKPGLMISLCAACHAIVERLQAVHTWLPPQLVILWREQHPGAECQLPLRPSSASRSRSISRAAVALDLIRRWWS